MASTDWNTNDQIYEHKLAASIINGHSADGTNFVFDQPSLDTLQRFCIDSTPSTREQIMQEEQWLEPDEEGAGKAAKGSLVGYLIVRHGTNDPAFDDRDLEMLRQWFAEGMPASQKVAR